MTRFGDLNPAIIAVWFFTVTGIAMFSNFPIISGITLVCGVTLFVVRNKREHLRTHFFFAMLFVILALANPIVSHNGKTILFVMNDNPVTLEAFLYGLNSSAMIVGVLYLFRSFTQILTSEKLLYITGFLSPKIAMLLTMAIRFVPLFGQQGRKVSDVQKAMGMYAEDNVIDDISGNMRVFSSVSTWALENGIVTADSMAARGFGSGKRTQMRRFGFRLCDGIFLLFTAVLGGICAFATAAEQLVFSFYPSLSTMQMGALGKCGISAYFLLLTMPVFIETEASIRWRSLQSRI